MDGGIWGYREASGLVPGAQLVGYKVKATDGAIGKIDKHANRHM
ncbi:hypothetical protein FBY35_4082 [Streptomyces sp. SLBN-118]|nr:hypothetical protein [Streptomyces sp. SLBN-118]TQK42654.1 hypothetical protein FBY35_4082 [Streptomyces sp. SLBN-118]